ncbi:MAG: tetratricopeptide repeat protein [Pirellulales bacterium]
MKAGFLARCVLYALPALPICWLLAGGQPGGPAEAAAQQASDAATRQYAAAAALQNREQYELAAEEWASFLGDFPSDERAGRAQHYLGICHLKNKEYEAALAAFEKVIADYPETDLLSSTHLHLGLTHYNLAVAGRKPLYDKALATFAALLDRYPESKEAAQARFYSGESLYAQGKKPQAVSKYRELIDKHPDDPLVDDALYAMGVAQEELGEAAAAGATYDAYLKRFADEALAAEVGLRRGETLAAQGQLEAAEKWFAAAAAKPGFSLADLALMRQAATLYERRQYAEAAEVYASLPQKFARSKHTGAAGLAAGKCLYLAGSFAEARQALTKVVLEGGQEALEAAHWLARSHLKEGQPDEALRIATAAIAKAADSPLAASLEMDRADALYEIPQRRPESAALYAALADRHPDDALAPQALYMASFAALGAGQHEAALVHAVKFMRRFADHELTADVTYVAAESYLQLGKYPESGRLYKHLLDKFPKHAETPTWQVRRGLALYLDKQHGQAIEALAAALPALGSTELAAEAHYVIGSSQNELGRFEEAARSLDQSLKVDPNWRQADEALLGLAYARRQLNDLSQARALLEQLIARFPNSRVLDRAHYRLGEYAYAAGDYAAAAAEYRRVIDDFGDSPLALQAVYALGWTQNSQHDYEAAEDTFDILLAGQPPAELAGRTRYARGLARQQLKRYAAAIDDLQTFLRDHPGAAEKSDARYVLALCQVGIEKPNEAVATLRRLLDDDPRYSGADKVLYELGWALESLNDSEAAAEAFTRLAAEHGDSPLAAEARYHVAEARYEEGDFKQAASAYYAAMQAAGKSELAEKAAHKLGWSFFKQDQFDKAQQAFAYQRATWPQGGLAADGAFMEAESLFKQGKFDEASAAYGQVGSGASKDFSVLALLHAGQAAGQLKQWEKSLELLKRAAAEHRDSEYIPEILYEQGWALKNLDRLDEAMQAFEAATAKTDREVAARARFMVGEIHFENKNHAEAVRNFFKVAYGYSYPTWQANAHYEAGRCFEVLRKNDQAQKSYQEVVDKFPDSDKAALAKERLAALKS